MLERKREVKKGKINWKEEKRSKERNIEGEERRWRKETRTKTDEGE